MSMTIEDQNGSTIACFTWSASSPAPLQPSYAGWYGYLNWAAYCPGAPAGITKIQWVSSVSTNVEASILVQEYTGLCTSAPCIDMDGVTNSPNGFQTGLIGYLSQRTSYSNELLVALETTVAGEPITTAGPCFNIDPGTTESNVNSNIIAGLLVASQAYLPSCYYTWTGVGDAGGILLMSVKTAASR